MKQKRSNKPIKPRRLCLDPQTKYCTGEYGHRGCCMCDEFNAGTPEWVDWQNGEPAPCQPYNLPGYFD